mgnify:CR=1 FL=1
MKIICGERFYGSLRSRNTSHQGEWCLRKISRDKNMSGRDCEYYNENRNAISIMNVRTNNYNSYRTIIFYSQFQ